MKTSLCGREVDRACSYVADPSNQSHIHLDLRSGDYETVEFVLSGNSYMIESGLEIDFELIDHSKGTNGSPVLSLRCRTEQSCIKNDYVEDHSSIHNVRSSMFTMNRASHRACMHFCRGFHAHDNDTRFILREDPNTGSYLSEKVDRNGRWNNESGMSINRKGTPPSWRMDASLEGDHENSTRTMSVRKMLSNHESSFCKRKAIVHKTASKNYMARSLPDLSQDCTKPDGRSSASGSPPPSFRRGRRLAITNMDACSLDLWRRDYHTSGEIPSSPAPTRRWRLMGTSGSSIQRSEEELSMRHGQPAPTSPTSEDCLAPNRQLGRSPWGALRTALHMTLASGSKEKRCSDTELTADHPPYWSSGRNIDGLGTPNRAESPWGHASRFSSETPTPYGDHDPDISAEDDNGSLRVGLLHFHAKEIAEELCFQDAALLQAVRWNEIATLGWMAKDKAVRAPNVKAMVDLTNKIALLVQTSILSGKTPEQRAGTIEKAIKVARSCFKLRNFNSLMAILGSLQSCAVYRLRSSWDLVSQKSMRCFETLCALMDPVENFSGYRKQLRKKQRKGSFIPFLGVFLSEVAQHREWASMSRRSAPPGITRHTSNPASPCTSRPNSPRPRSNMECLHGRSSSDTSTIMTATSLHDKHTTGDAEHTPVRRSMGSSDDLLCCVADTRASDRDTPTGSRSKSALPLQHEVIQCMPVLSTFLNPMLAHARSQDLVNASPCLSSLSSDEDSGPHHVGSFSESTPQRHGESGMMQWAINSPLDTLSSLAGDEARGTPISQQHPSKRRSADLDFHYDRDSSLTSMENHSGGWRVREVLRLMRRGTSKDELHIQGSRARSTPKGEDHTDNALDGIQRAEQTFLAFQAAAALYRLESRPWISSLIQATECRSENELYNLSTVLEPTTPPC